MGVGHVFSGLAVGVASLPLLGSDPDPVHQIAWVSVLTGMSIGPDLDTGSSRAGGMWGPLTRGVRVRVWRKRRTILPGVSTIVGTLAGGHRRGTHSILGLIVVLTLTWMLSLTRIGTGVVLAFAIGLGLEAAGALVPGKQWVECWPANLLVSIGGAVALTQAGVHLPLWLPFAMALGAAVHIAGDMITLQGCPLSWPTGTKRISLLPLRAGGFTERFILTPIFGVVTFVLLAQRAGFDPMSAIIDAWETTT
jgi:membrane-bound metal-dependent hydrolase YbcI (DUF457 family)